ncbi:DUF1517 domain-containing protein [Nodularia spumigena CS-584]|jgi:uncharacterized membrane protein|uniref:DUF1517 domain-containing protein n=1 Tax=Nodularia spumigena UHCC 0060 TaxID=3110300 RepID=A0ABU5UQL6_NODSP|nr:MULTISPECIES: DUF1517 domain-containing protein [Cyanophyceae]MDB9355312.1 DUF1517 domain-containing protein [Nodularia spumigena CS-587/03]AHJ31618.1 Hypothetical glycine rich membrane protein DUF1517 [Nodularia spumigena CCY9414]EAW45656.1 hypothetical protein N9414_18253 [Nodularia spumigena CCY9414]MDB9306872.1 DUF1517 domain-containing protein [Nodularia spumigena CS-591/12]MDB9324236.1 DUF1517 domain-containing protein [Nodularia spumigena CS-591/07A]
MRNKLQKTIKPLFKIFFLFSLVLTLALSHADGALAARSGGRIGGGSFRAPSSRTYTPRTYAPGGGGGYYPGGGGFGFPFLIPFWGIGGGFGGIFSILIFFAIANFLVQTFRRVSSGEGEEVGYSSNPPVSVTRLQVGLLAQARGLQSELNKIAESADTNSPEGRAEVLQEASLALLRHPEYWVYAGGGTQQVKLTAAESQFNRLSLAERSKFSEETLSNVNNQLKAALNREALPTADQLDNPTQLISEGPGEYLIVTLLAATLGKFDIPEINSSDDLRQALRRIGGIPGDQLLAIEVLWTPQAEGDTLTSDDILAEYTDLKLV